MEQTEFQGGHMYAPIPGPVSLDPGGVAAVIVAHKNDDPNQRSALYFNVEGGSQLHAMKSGAERYLFSLTLRSEAYPQYERTDSFVMSVDDREPKIVVRRATDSEIQLGL